MNIQNITTILPYFTDSQCPPIEPTFIYVLFVLHLTVIVTIIVLTELVKYHIINPRQTNEIIDGLKTILTNIPTIPTLV